MKQLYLHPSQNIKFKDVYRLLITTKWQNHIKKSFSDRLYLQLRTATRTGNFQNSAQGSNTENGIFMEENPFSKVPRRFVGDSGNWQIDLSTTE